MKGTFLCLLLFLSVTASAGIYRWVDENGKTHFGDRPPQTVETENVNLRYNTFSGYEVKENEGPATKKVVMYSTEWCGVCKRAKRYFKANNIPFVEYDIEKSRKAAREYKKLGGRGVPLILVGKQRMSGFSEAGFKKIYGGDS